MRTASPRRSVAVALAIAAVLFAGCKKDQSTGGRDDASSNATADGAADGDALAVGDGADGSDSADTTDGDATPGPWEPKVVLSDAHGKTCLVNVGDTMPEMTLPDLEGNDHKLADLLGDHLTVVVFWTSGKIYAREQFLRLGLEVVEPFSSQGVHVVTVNVGEQVDQVQPLAEEAQATFPVLLDVDSSAFGKVATSKLPRTYLLDADGKILWFSLEYSRDSLRELSNAIAYFSM